MLLIAGPSLLDDKALASDTAGQLHDLCHRLHIRLIFKAAFKRINSGVAEAFTGLGAEPALKHLKAIGKMYNIPVQTDVYNELDVFVASKYADILQIPAYLFRETSLLEAAARSGRTINIRKGMTIKGIEMGEAVHKINRKGSNQILLTERGTMMGYDDVVVDFRNIFLLLKNNLPLFLDLSNTISVSDDITKETEILHHAALLGKAALAAGVCGIILDAHAHPAIARESAGYCFQTSKLEPLLTALVSFKKKMHSEI